MIDFVFERINLLNPLLRSQTDYQFLQIKNEKYPHMNILNLNHHKSATFKNMDYNI